MKLMLYYLFRDVKDLLSAKGNLDLDVQLTYAVAYQVYYINARYEHPLDYLRVVVKNIENNDKFKDAYQNKDLIKEAQQEFARRRPDDEGIIEEDLDSLR